MDNQDFLEKAKSLSNFLNNNNNTPDIEKVIKIASSIKTLNEKQNINDKNNLPNISLENPNIKTIKSVLPFLDIEHKKNVGIFIEMMEVNHILNEYRVMKNNDTIERNKLKKDAFVAIKSHLKEENRNFVDLIIKFLEINEITNKINLRKE